MENTLELKNLSKTYASCRGAKKPWLVCALRRARCDQPERQALPDEL